MNYVPRVNIQFFRVFAVVCSIGLFSLGHASEVHSTEASINGLSHPIGETSVERPVTLTITTGGGHKIADRVVSLFGRTPWRFNYMGAPEIEMEVNQALLSDGYDITPSHVPNGWFVSIVANGDPASYSPPADGYEEKKANLEQAARFVGGLFAALLTGNSNIAHGIGNGATANSPDTKYLTKAMLDGVPPGAKKILLTRIANPMYRAQQEVLTVAYSDVDDVTMRRINARAIVEMIGLSKQLGEKYAEATDAGPGSR